MVKGPYHGLRLVGRNQASRGEEVLCEAARLAEEHVLRELPTVPHDDPHRPALEVIVARHLDRSELALPVEA